MRTFDILLDKYKDRYVPLSEVCEPYYGISYKTACRYAAMGKIRAFRLNRSKKCPWLVSLDALAEDLDKASLLHYVTQSTTFNTL